MKSERICEVCGKKIPVESEFNIKGNKRDVEFFSDEGFYFEEGNVWFCNECHSEIMKFHEERIKNIPELNLKEAKNE